MICYFKIKHSLNSFYPSTQGFTEALNYESLLSGITYISKYTKVFKKAKKMLKSQVVSYNIYIFKGL